MIKAILFDFGQTLVDAADGFRTAEKEAQAKLFANMSLTRHEDFMAHYRRIRKEFHDRSNFSRTALWREVYFYYCLEFDDQLLETWETEYWQTVRAKTIVFPETIDVLKRLSSTYQLGLITNTQGQQRTETHRLSQFPELKKYFEVIIIAGEDGISPKPARQPFHLCLNGLDVKPAEAVYVGDDYRIDVCGSLEAGLHAVWIQHHTVERSWSEVEATVPIITCLDQLLELEHLVKTQ
jgi:HAD superfamily hydrolase (TIGR01549 family)